MSKVEWISVEDKLPENNNRILINSYEIEIGYYEYDTFYVVNNGDYSDGGYGQDYEATPTHWMPLPEPPKENP